MKHAAVVVALLFAAALGGCGAAKGVVNGTVAFDGQAIANGSIVFVKSDGELVREGAVIRDGSFQTQLPPGNYQVELYAQKVVAKRKQTGFSGEPEELDITEELFPDWCNTKTQLTQQIKLGPNEIKLDLKSKK